MPFSSTEICSSDSHQGSLASINPTCRALTLPVIKHTGRAEPLQHTAVARLSCGNIFSSAKKRGPCTPGYLFLRLLKCWSSGGEKNPQPPLCFFWEESLPRTDTRIVLDPMRQCRKPDSSEMEGKPDPPKPGLEPHPRVLFMTFLWASPSGS